LGNQKLGAKTARRHQAELHTANSTAAMAKLAGTATKFTQMPELSTNLQLLIYAPLDNSSLASKIGRHELQSLNLQDKNTTNHDQKLESVAQSSILGELGRTDLKDFEQLVKGCSFELQN
jgi:hypothetical protein